MGAESVVESYNVVYESVVHGSDWTKLENTYTISTEVGLCAPLVSLEWTGGFAYKISEKSGANATINVVASEAMVDSSTIVDGKATNVSSKARVVGTCVLGPSKDTDGSEINWTN